MADKFRKGKSNFATTLVTGIGTGTGDTITLNSTTGLPTDTEITLTFNRVTSGGVVNSTSVMERITGTISGATLTSYRRGVDGTTEQAHAGGVVVEYIPNAADMNDQVDGILVGHNQDGTHKSGIVLTLPQINDTSSDHQYVVAVSELAEDRTVTLPLLTGNDEFTFKDVAQTLTNKTLTSPVINTPTGDVATLTGTQTLTNKTIVQKVTAYTPAGAGTTTIDLTTGNIHTVTMPAATQTLAISNEAVGQCFIVEINNVTSQGVLTWFTTIRWDSGTEPTLTGTNGKRDVFGFRVTGTDTYDGFIVGQNI